MSRRSASRAWSPLGSSAIFVASIAGCTSVLGLNAPERAPEPNVDAGVDGESPIAETDARPPVEAAPQGTCTAGAKETEACPGGTRSRTCEGTSFGAWGACAANGWRTIASPPFPFAARAHAQVAWTGDEILVWGGVSVDGNALLRDGAGYRPSTGAWRLLAASPLPPRERTSAAFDGEHWIFVGGTIANDAGVGETYLSDVALYDAAHDAWRDYAKVGVLGVRGYVAAISVPAMHRAVFWGGETSLDTPAATGTVYDGDRGIWEAMDEAPVQARSAPIVGLVASRVYVLGGKGCTEEYVVDDGCYDGASYDLATRRWAKLGNVAHQLGERTGMGSTVCGASGTEIVAFGGYDSDPHVDGVRFDTTTGAFTPIPEAKSGGRYLAGANASAFCVDGTFGVWGGADAPGGAATHAAPALYDAASNAWHALENGPMSSLEHASVVIAGGDLFVLGGKSEKMDASFGVYAYRFEAAH